MQGLLAFVPDDMLLTNKTTSWKTKIRIALVYLEDVDTQTIESGGTPLRPDGTISHS